MVDLSPYTQKTSAQSIGFQDAPTPQIVADPFKVLSQAAMGAVDKFIGIEQEKLEKMERVKRDQRKLQLQKDAIDFSANNKVKEQEMRERLGNNTQDYFNRYQEFYDKNQNEFLKNYNQEEQEALKTILLSDYEQGVNNAIQYQVTSGARIAKENITAISDTLIQGITENPQDVGNAINKYQTSLDAMEALPNQQKKELLDKFTQDAQKQSKRSRMAAFDYMASKGDVEGMIKFSENENLTQGLDRADKIYMQQKIETTAEKQKTLLREDPATFMETAAMRLRKPYDAEAIEKAVNLQIKRGRGISYIQVMPKNERQEAIDVLSTQQNLNAFNNKLDEIKDKYGDYQTNAISDLIREGQKQGISHHFYAMMGMDKIEDAEEMRSLFNVIQADRADNSIQKIAKQIMDEKGIKQKDFQLAFNQEIGEVRDMLMREGLNYRDLDNMSDSLYMIALEKYTRDKDQDSAIKFAVEYPRKQYNILDFNGVNLRLPQGYDTKKIEDGLDDIQENMLDDQLNKGVLYIGTQSEKIESINNRTQINDAYWALSRDGDSLNLYSRSGLFIFSEDTKKPISIALNDLSSQGEKAQKRSIQRFEAESIKNVIKEIPPNMRNEFVRNIGKDPKTYLKSLGLKYEADK